MDFVLTDVPASVKRLLKSPKPLRPHASARRYYRGEDEGESSIMVEYGEDTVSLQTYQIAHRCFSAVGIPIPALKAISIEEGWAIQEDLGDIHINEDLRRAPTRLRLHSYRNLMAFQASLAKEGGRWYYENEPEELAVSDEDWMRSEVKGFIHHFMGDLCNCADAGTALEPLIRKLVSKVAEFPTSLAHRDLHSENILVKERRLFLIDFQDALLAPRMYDAVSCLHDAYFRLRPEEYHTLSKEWITQVVGNGPQSQEEFVLTSLQRLLKMLGTFGLLVARRKMIHYWDALRRTLFYIDRLSPEIERLGFGDILAALEPVAPLFSAEEKP